jgi:hypothetical protein
MKMIQAAVWMFFLGASTTLLHAAPGQSPNVTSPAASAPAATSAGATPTVAPALTPPSPYPNGPNCCGQPAKPHGSCLHRLLAWATYCPKERIGCCQSCNTCRYKGSLPLYAFFGKICVEGSGVHPTLPPDCCHGHKGCKGCKGCANGPPCGCK